MESSIFPRYSLNLYEVKQEISLPPRTWPLRIKERQNAIIDDDVWPEIVKPDPEALLVKSVRKKRLKSRRYSVKDVEYLSLVMEKPKTEGELVMMADSVHTSSRSTSLSPPHQRKTKKNHKIAIEPPAERVESSEVESIEERVEISSKKSLEQNTTPPQVRRTLSLNFLKGPKIQRTSTAPSLEPGSKVHALKEVDETLYRVAQLPPREIFSTMTRETDWNEPVQPAFDEIIIRRETDKDNVCVLTISPMRNSKNKIVEKTLNYYMRLVRELYRQQGFFKIRREQIQEQIERLRNYEMPRILNGSMRSTSSIDLDFETMENDLKDIPCLDVLRRLSTRGFAPATYASLVLWPALFPSPQAILDVEMEAKTSGKKQFYLKGSQINSAATITLKRNKCHVIQRKLFEFSAILLSRVKVPHHERKQGKYDLVFKEVPIGSLVVSLKTKHKENDNPYHTFSLRMEDVTPLNIEDLRNIESDASYTHKDRSRAERVQQFWLRETMEFHFDKQLVKNGVVIDNGLLLYPGRKRPT